MAEEAKDTSNNSPTEVVDDDMTPDERVAWLRERGIEVETHEERKASQQAAVQAQAQALRSVDEETGAEEEEETTIHYVLIPCDASQPLQELSLTTRIGEDSGSSKSAVLGGGGGDVLAEHLKDRFREGSDRVDLGLLDPERLQQTLSSADVSVSESTLRSVAQREGHVETFSLVHPTTQSSSGTTYPATAAYQLYLDEIGALKRLPLNARAAQYARRAGYDPPPAFHGDVYLGKTVVPPRRSVGGGGIVRNASLRLSDAAFDAPWMASAVETNLQYQMERNKLTGSRDARQPGVAGADGKAKEEDDYSWTQTEEEVEVRLALPSGEDKAAAKKSVKVNFRPRSFEVQYRQKPLLALALFERVDVDSGTWTLECSKDENVLVLSMEKVEAAYWPRIRD